MVDGAPQMVALAIDADNDFIEAPAPVRVVASGDTPFPNLGGEHGPEPVPPVPNSLVRNVNAAFEQDGFDLAQGQRKADVQHDREADDLGRTVEKAEGIVIHGQRLREVALWLKPVFSDTTPLRALVRRLLEHCLLQQRLKAIVSIIHMSRTSCQVPCENCEVGKLTLPIRLNVE